MIVDSTVTFEEFKEMVKEGYSMEFNDDVKMISVLMKNSEDYIYVTPKDISFYFYFKDYYISKYLEEKYFFKNYYNMDSFKKIFKDEILLDAVEKIIFNTTIFIEDEYEENNILGKIPSEYKIVRKNESSYGRNKNNESIFEIIIILKNGIELSYKETLNNYCDIYLCKHKFIPFKKAFYFKNKTNPFIQNTLKDFNETKNELENLFKDKFVFVETNPDEKDYSIYTLNKSRTTLNPSCSTKSSKIVSKMI